MNDDMSLRRVLAALLAIPLAGFSRGFFTVLGVVTALRVLGVLPW